MNKGVLYTLYTLKNKLLRVSTSKEVIVIIDYGITFNVTVFSFWFLFQEKLKTSSKDSHTTIGALTDNRGLL